MMELIVLIRLLSDASFGKGNGSAGVVDMEIEYDPQTHLPIIKGRTLKGLLVDAVAELLYSLEQIDATLAQRYQQAAAELFGRAGSSIEDRGLLHIGTAQLPPGLIKRLRATRKTGGRRYKDAEVFAALTTIHYQTAVDDERDTPQDESLRALRAVLRETVFVAPIIAPDTLNADQARLLNAAVVSVRRGGLQRKRGRGRLHCAIINEDWDAEALLKAFEEEIGA